MPRVIANQAARNYFHQIRLAGSAARIVQHYYRARRLQREPRDRPMGARLVRVVKAAIEDVRPVETGLPSTQTSAASSCDEVRLRSVSVRIDDRG